MFYLQTKDKRNKFLTLYNYFFGLFIGFPIMIIMLVINILFIFNKDVDFVVNGNLGCIITLTTLGSIAYIINFLMNNKGRKMATLEFLDIVDKTTLPSKLPKVVYVYTTKNDFMKARLLQNMQQDYLNIEYGISVGGPNDKNIEEIKKFAKENNINLYILENESKSKADNLNNFLKNSGATFDYLLIGDADVAFDKNFTSTSLKFFYSKNALRLGYVSSTIFNYRGDNGYTNSFLHFENAAFILKHQQTNYIKNTSPNLYSSCCLISGDMIREMQNKFPESNLEDGYTEKYANKNLGAGIISPLSIAMQSYDKNVGMGIKRLSRLYTGGIKYCKESFFKNYNTKFEVQNLKEMGNLFLGFIVILSFIIGVTLIGFVSINFITIFTNKYYIVLFSIFIFNLISILITKAYYARHIAPTDVLKRSLLSFFYANVLFVVIIKNWFNALFLSKYASFDNSFKTKKVDKSLKVVKKEIYLSILFFCVLFAINFVLVGYKTYETHIGYIYLLVLLNSIFLTPFLYNLSLVILHKAGSIKSNKLYNENNFVYCTNDFVLQTKTKQEYYSKKGVDR